jgi:hypothetical protein
LVLTNITHEDGRAGARAHTHIPRKITSKGSSGVDKIGIICIKLHR